MFNFKARGGFGVMHQATSGRQLTESHEVEILTTRGDATERAVNDIIDKAMKKIGTLRKGASYRERDLEVIVQNVSTSAKTGHKIWEIVLNKDSMTGPWALASIYTK